MSLLDTNALNTVNSLANDLGLNSWQLETATWNGYEFATSSSSLLSALKSTGAIGSAVAATTAIVGSVAQAIGYNTGFTVPFGANMGGLNMVDTFSRRLAINSLPNGRDNIRGMGYKGQKFTLLGIGWGTNYLNGVKNNLLNMFYSDQVILPTDKNYHVLKHPLLGTLKGVWLESMKVVHQSTSWRSCVYELNFISETPIGFQNKQPRTTRQIINDSISAILATANALNTLWANYQFIADSNSVLRGLANNSLVQNQVQTIQAQTLGSINNALNVTKLMTINLAPAGYNNTQLNNASTTNATLPQISYFQTHSTPQDINNLIDYITQNINSTITTIYGTNVNYYYDTINLLQAFISQLSYYAQNLLQSYYGQTQQYKVPYNMNLFIACQLNGINYESNYENIISLNQNKFFWLNKLTKNDIITLPLGNI